MIESHSAPFHEFVANASSVPEQINLTIVSASAAHEPRCVMGGGHYLIVVIIPLATRSEHPRVAIDGDERGPGTGTRWLTRVTTPGSFAPHADPTKPQWSNATDFTRALSGV
jgi:hypothetical protein